MGLAEISKLYKDGEITAREANELDGIYDDDIEDDYDWFEEEE